MHTSTAVYNDSHYSTNTLHTHRYACTHVQQSTKKQTLSMKHFTYSDTHTHSLSLSQRCAGTCVQLSTMKETHYSRNTLHTHTHTHPHRYACTHVQQSTMKQTPYPRTTLHTHTHTHTHTQACTSVYNETDSLLKKHSTHTHTHSQIGTHTHTHTHTQRANLSISHAHLPLPSSYTPSLFPDLVVKKSMDQCVCVKSSAIRHQEPISSISGNSPSLHCLQGRSFHTIATVVWRVVLQYELPSLASVIS